MSSDSFGFAWGPPTARRFHSTLLFACTHLSSGSVGSAWVQSGTTRGRRVHSVSRGLTQARLVVIGFILVRVDSFGRAHAGSFDVFIGSFDRNLGSWCSFGFHLVSSSDSVVLAWVLSGAPGGRRVHKGSHGLTRARVGIVEFIRVRVGSLGRT